MTIKHFWLLAALLFALPVGAQLYRWVDAQGQVHYSDTPQNGAEEITLKPTNVIQSRPKQAVQPAASRTPSREAFSEQSEDEDAFEGYTSIDVTSPTPDQVLWNIGGELTVSVSIQPALQPNHGVVVYLDGKAINEPVASTSLTIGDVYRGTHSVRAAIVSDQGKVMINGSSITFHVRQNGIN